MVGLPSRSFPNRKTKDGLPSRSFLNQKAKAGLPSRSFLDQKAEAARLRQGYGAAPRRSPGSPGHRRVAPPRGIEPRFED